MSDLEYVWWPQPRQAMAVNSPFTFTFFGGARGGGKTDVLLGGFLMHQQMYGKNARGILFRRSYKEFDDIVRRSKEIYLAIGARFGKSDYTWHFPSGAVLAFRHVHSIDDASLYQGHQYTWMGFDELTQWGFPEPVDMLLGSLRSPHGIPPRCIYTANPGGPGHTWVKSRFVNRARPMCPFDLLNEHGNPIIDIEGKPMQAVFIPSLLTDNPELQKQDPNYASRLHLVGAPELVRAWLEGDWDIVAGGMFSDLWNRKIHVLRPFEIPQGWKINRSFDWGGSKPFSVGWWAESDGTQTPGQRHYPKGTLFRIGEWYGWTGIANKGLGWVPKQIAKGIKEREANFPWGNRVQPGPADPSIFDTAGRESSIASEMADHGVSWNPGNNASRVTRWQKMRSMMKNSLDFPMEDPGLFVFDTCVEGFLRTIPEAPRDAKKLDDLDTDSEDHVADEAGYRIMEVSHQIFSIEMR
jgi:hypothetical protein